MMDKQADGVHRHVRNGAKAPHPTNKERLREIAHYASGGTDDDKGRRKQLAQPNFGLTHGG